MALIDPAEVFKADIPGEPGEWVKYRVLTAGIVEKLEDRTSSAMAAASIVEWSYPIPPTHANVRDRLDVNTFYWLVNTINAKSGLRSDPESNGSESPSSPTSEPATGASRKNSAT